MPVLPGRSSSSSGRRGWGLTAIRRPTNPGGRHGPGSDAARCRGRSLRMARQRGMRPPGGGRGWRARVLPVPPGPAHGEGAEVRSVTLTQGSQEWLDARRSLVTATDIGVLLGLSPYKCEADLADEKRGLAPDAESNIRMRIGLAL